KAPPISGVVRSQGTETNLRAATKVNVRGASSQYIQQGLLRELELESPSPGCPSGFCASAALNDLNPIKRHVNPYRKIATQKPDGRPRALVVRRRLQSMADLVGEMKPSRLPG